ncbi:hypothetical protein T492DRAFT_1150006 [Pavlovales sp. CCMP2436]|nr:hypothetical protein T492DRAFT_1150006 [Pavlovales sp. CCMP2436]
MNVQQGRVARCFLLRTAGFFFFFAIEQKFALTNPISFSKGAWLAASFSAPPIKVEQAWLQEALFPFEGDSSCCARGHPGGGKCERETLVRPMLSLYSNRYAEAHAAQLKQAEILEAAAGRGGAHARLQREASLKEKATRLTVNNNEYQLKGYRALF